MSLMTSDLPVCHALCLLRGSCFAISLLFAPVLLV
jgi:hypothetical protein